MSAQDYHTYQRFEQKTVKCGWYKKAGESLQTHVVKLMT